MKCDMLSLEEISAVPVAISLCDCPELKKEILCVPGSDYHANEENHKHSKEILWHETIRKKATVLLRNLILPKQIHGTLLNVIPWIGLRMLAWADYHERILGFSREFSVNFLNSSFLTQPGIVDNRKAAEALMKEKKLSTMQKYKLACIYCITDDISMLFSQLQMRNKEEFQIFSVSEWNNTPELVEFWTDYQMGLMGHLEESVINELMFQKAIESGNKAAVEYCLKRRNFECEIDSIETAMKVLGRRERRSCVSIVIYNDIYPHDDDDDEREFWITDDYYTDILYFLFSKITVNEKKQLLYDDPSLCRLLIDFLNWPYQNFFMKMAKLILEFLDEEDYKVVLESIYDRIRSRDKISNGIQNCCYKMILKEFWQQSPEIYKRYVLGCEAMSYGEHYRVQVISNLLITLTKLKNFNLLDKENIQLILNSATPAEKQHIISSYEWGELCFELVSKKRWKILELFTSNCFSSKNQAASFLKDFLCTEHGRRVCVRFTEAGEWNLAESFIRWIVSTEEKINEFKNEIIYSHLGKLACFRLLDKGVGAVDRYIRWHFLYEEEAMTFKEELILKENELYPYNFLVQKYKFEVFEEFTTLCLSSEKEIREFKQYIAYHKGKSICKELLTRHVHHNCCSEYQRERHYCKFKEFRWEEVEKFLTWCFPSEEEISKFKRENVQDLDLDIHFSLITANRWEDADIFFAWLGLSAEEIKELKEETLLDHDYVTVGRKFLELMFSENSDDTIQESIELLIKWCLSDKETVLKFSDDFKRWCVDSVFEIEGRNNFFRNFDLAVMRCLGDLDEEERGYSGNI